MHINIQKMGGVDEPGASPPGTGFFTCESNINMHINIHGVDEPGASPPGTGFFFQGV